MRRKVLLLAVLLCLVLPAGGASQSSPAFRLVRVGVDGSHRTVVLAASGYYVQDLSRDRTQLLDARGGTLEIRDLDGANARVVTTTPNQIDTATWAPRSNRIAFTTADLSTCGPAATKCATFQVWLVSTAGNGLRKVGNDTIYPAWSTDGRRLALVGHFSTSGQSGRLAVASADGRRIRFLRGNGEIAHIEWAPRGDRLAYATSFPGDIRVTGTARTSRPTVMVRGSYFAWNPSGRSIAVGHVEPNRGSHPRTDLMVVDVATRRSRTIASGPNIPLIAWSPDGRWIAYARTQQDMGQVLLIHPNGRGRRVIASEPGLVDITRIFWLPNSSGVIYDVGS